MAPWFKRIHCPILIGLADLPCSLPVHLHYCAHIMRRRNNDSFDRGDSWLSKNSFCSWFLVHRSVERRIEEEKFRE